VQPSETITLVLSLSTTTVTLESQLRSGAGDEQVEGRIESLPPTMPAGADLADGDRVEVKGLQRDGYVYAERIHINPMAR
jgi:hypothetical protein